MTTLAPTPSSPTKRRDAFLHFLVDEAPGLGAFKNLEKNHWSSLFFEIPKFEAAAKGRNHPPLNQTVWDNTLQWMLDHRDCCDFQLNGLLRLLYRHPDSSLWTPDLLNRCRTAVLGFKYWLDEPEEDRACMLSENHQILYHTCQYLAGNLYPKERFTVTGRTGEEQARIGRERVERWMDWRSRFGFSEWLSHHYYDEDFTALANIFDYAPDADLRKRAAGLMEIMLFELAVHQQGGTLGSTGGRLYKYSIINPIRQLTSPVTWLFWGEGHYHGCLSMSAISFATSGFQPDPIIPAIALDRPEQLEHRQRSSITVEESEAYGMDPDNLDHFPFYSSAGAGQHRRLVESACAYVPMKHGNASWGVHFARKYFRECEERGESYDPHPSQFGQSQVNAYLYRTPDTMLSCVQDFRKGYPGYQQHIWQATLGGPALVFTTTPSPEKNDRPDAWAGNAIIPRTLAYRQVLVSLHRIKPRPQMGMQPLPHRFASHAYFPHHAFDEVREVGNWTFGRKNNGYVALWCSAPTTWTTPEPDMLTIQFPRDTPAPEEALPYERLAEGDDHVWICELGNNSVYGSFDQFVDRISKAAVSGNTEAVRYQSPESGNVACGWDTPLSIDGKTVSIKDYPRFDSPYCQTAFGETTYRLHLGAQEHTIML